MAHGQHGVHLVGVYVLGTEVLPCASANAHGVVDVHFAVVESYHHSDGLEGRAGLYAVDGMVLHLVVVTVLGAIDVLVVDSVAAMTTKAEIEGEMGDSHVGMLARLMSQAMRKLTAIISKSNCVAIFINQVREKIGVMYGNPETTPGGRAFPRMVLWIREIYR